RTAPVVKLAVPKQTLPGVRKALRLKVSCDEACSGKVTVTGKGVKFAGRVYLTRAGVAKLKLRPTVKARRVLARLATRKPRSTGARSLGLTARASLKDAAGNTGRASLRFKVTA
ncbi:MAG TPA: hypothetical protein PLX70_07460, partial [Solirubrobacterales bacterium]|nr:hypothetical protein [Solirubrobacterales bacterium]